jgi:hypothetical protein
VNGFDSFSSRKGLFLRQGMVALSMADTDRRPLTLAVATWAYLDQLSKLGTHGTSVPDVAKTLIEEGIRQAIKDGFLNQRPPASASSGTEAA